MTSVLKGLPFNPFVTGPLWLLLTKAPDNIRQPILQWLRKHVSAATIRYAISTLKWLSALGLATRAHIILTNLAQNNWRITSERHRYDWPKEIAVITGASGGFGSLIAKGLAAKGVTVIAVDITDKLPADMASNPKIHYHRCNITDRQAVMDLAAQIRSAHGAAPSILVNNAGVAFTAAIANCTEADVRKLFDVNLISHYWTLAAFLPAMLAEKKGHVVTLASLASFVTLPGMAAYANTKAALVSLHEGLQTEARALYNAPEVKFTIVHPNFAATNMVAPSMAELKKAGAVLLKPEAVSDAVVRQILSCRGRHIMVPSDAWWTSTVRAWPSYASYVMHRIAEMWATGVETAMSS